MLDPRIPTSIWKDDLGFTLYLGNIDKTSSLLNLPSGQLSSYSFLQVGKDGFDFLLDGFAWNENVINIQS